MDGGGFYCRNAVLAGCIWYPREIVFGILVASFLVSNTADIEAEEMQLDGWPPEWEMHSDQVAAFEMAVAEIRNQLPAFPIDEFDILLLDKEHEFVFLFMHESIRLNELHFCGCGLPDNPTWEVGVSKDAARITHSYCPR